MDIRLGLAQEVAEQIDAQVQEQLCETCRHPWLMVRGQGLAYCWFCAVDREAAHRARTTLTKAKMAASGIVMEVDHAPQALRVKRELEGCWPEGMAL